MNIRQLHYFVTVVEQTTFTHAASLLHISQPSLSTAIKKLEERVGFTLLDRSKRKLEVTKEGKIVYLEAKKLLTHVEYVRKEISRLQKQGPLELSVGLIESAKDWLPQTLHLFKKQAKDVQIKLHEILSLQDVENSLTHFKIHLAITNQYIQNKDIEMIPIYEERLVALLPPTHRLKNASSVTLHDLRVDDFIISKKGYQTREDILHAFRKQGMTPNIQFEIERLETACSLVENELGVTLLPENYVKYAKNKAFHVKEIHDAHISRPVYIAFVNSRYLPPIVGAFLNIIQKFFRETNKKENDSNA